MKTFWSCLPVLFAMIVGHLCSPVVRADETGTTSKIVRRETNVTTGKSITTYTDGHVLTITPGTPSTPVVETFAGYPISPIVGNSVGDYDYSQGVILNRIIAHQRHIDSINAANYRAQLRSNGSSRGSGRTRLNLNYNLN
jgi:hypothetical protein